MYICTHDQQPNESSVTKQHNSHNDNEYYNLEWSAIRPYTMPYAAMNGESNKVRLTH